MKSKISYILISVIFFAYTYTKEKQANNLKKEILRLEKEVDNTALDWDACKYYYCDLWSAEFQDTRLRHEKLGEYVCK